MRTIRSFLLVLGLMLSLVMPAYAATTGLVHDEAGMFPAGNSKPLEETAQKGAYTFHILTVTSLKGEEPQAYADRVYREWGLGPEDILLLLSRTDRRVELNFRNPELLRKLEARMGRSQPIDAFVAEEFIPYAQAGDFTGGAVNLMRAVQELPAAPAAGTGSAPEGIPSTNRTGSSGLPVGPLVLGLAAAALAMYLMYSWRMRGRLVRLRGEAESTFVAITRTSEELREYIGLVQGETEKLVQAADGKLTDLTVRANELVSALKEHGGSFLNAAGLGRFLGEMEARHASLKSEYDEVHKEVEHLEKVDKSVKSKVTDLSSRLQSLKAETDKLAQEKASR
ncbi:TPM domain-containing protein [Paenibacillus sp. CC-CFT747]|nr:TPM domain-containing protein [Paenibacillus sp. CC-CFT747]